MRTIIGGFALVPGIALVLALALASCTLAPVSRPSDASVAAEVAASAAVVARAGAVAAPAATRTPVSLGELPGWRDDDDLAPLRAALVRQCALPHAPDPWPVLCRTLPASDRLHEWVEANFAAWPLGADAQATGLLTGYYEPLLTGSRRRESARQVPLLGRPADMIAGPNGTRLRVQAGKPAAPYPARAAIEADPTIAGNELLWIDDPVEAFFLHVQGSGRVRLRDGSIVRVGFADHNGQPYRAIGRELVERGELAKDAVDAQAIKDWLHAHPDEARAVMQTNRRYVFFRELPPATQSDAEDGPIGSLGVALTAGRSVATDPAHVPAAALLFVDSTHPDDGSALQRLVVSQDRGAAITGPVRADLFWGSGDEAGRLAGTTKQPARIWLLWVRGSAPPGFAPVAGPVSGPVSGSVRDSSGGR